jgi:hypothetical protein
MGSGKGLVGTDKKYEGSGKGKIKMKERGGIGVRSGGTKEGSRKGNEKCNGISGKGEWEVK